MSRDRQTIDQRPGSLPDIRTDAGSITFALAPPAFLTMRD